MSIDLQTPLSTLAELVRAADPDAVGRRPWLARVQQILAGRADAGEDQRRELFDQLERWRYDFLDEPRGPLTAEDRRAVDAMDLAANRLAGAAERPARWPRAAVQGSGDRGQESGVRVRESGVRVRESGVEGRAVACLDPEVGLEELAEKAAELTCEYFFGSGKGRRRMLLYAPLYLSNHCINHCLYCGFRQPHEIRRKHLDAAEAVGQAEILGDRKFRHILLVAGDCPGLTTTDYFAQIIRKLVARYVRPAVEIAPQSTASYTELAAAGACGVTLYQETYDEKLYARYHPRGSKASYDWRLEGIERAAEAGIRRLGLGILLGLADPRMDLLAMIRHAGYLQTRFPECTLAFSLPRIHEAPQGFQAPWPVDDETFIRLYCTLRIAFPRAELVLSTREAASLRNRLAGICITQMSAGSSTVPGGYRNGGAKRSAGRQFPVCDRRSAAEVARWLAEAGFEVAWNVAEMEPESRCHG